MAICRNRDTAQDLVQEASMISWKKRDQFEPGTHFGAWTGQIVRNLALRHGRDAGRRATVALEPQQVAAPAMPSAEASGTSVTSLDPDHNATQQADRLGLDDHLSAALDELGDTARVCFLLRVVDNLSYQEISETLDLPANTAMSHVHRSRKKVLQTLSVGGAA